MLVRRQERSGVLVSETTTCGGSSVYDGKTGKPNSDNHTGRNGNDALRIHAQGLGQDSDDMIGGTTRYDIPANQASKLQLHSQPG